MPVRNDGNGPRPAGRLPVFGRRHGRPLRPGRRALLDNRLAGIAVELPAGDQLLDPARLFADAVADVWLEIGFGAGEHLAGRALAHPEVGFIGCEPYANGVAALLARIAALKLERVRIFADDGRLLLSRLAANSLGRAFVLFGDPWPKRRHRRRRFIQPETLDQFARVLRPGGELLFASDNMDYVRCTLAMASAHPALAWCVDGPRDWREPPAGWVATRYQSKALSRGASCVYLRFRRRCPGGNA
jgi:tRNA (guanine-N7-)-methyltransferase